jgi:hypothetical protein
MKLTDFDILLIRACKACKPYKETIRRLKRIHAIRSSINSCHIEESFILYDLAELVNDLGLISLPDFISKVKEHESYQKMYKDFNPNTEEIDCTMLTCISILRITKPEEDLPNFRIPAYFRNKRS